MFRAEVSRVQFNTHSPDWQQCMDKCWRYNRAQAPSFHGQEELDELLSWGRDTFIDPISGEGYPDAYSGYFWLPYK